MSLQLSVFSPLLVLLLSSPTSTAFMAPAHKATNGHIIDATENGAMQPKDNMHMVRGNWGGGEYRDFNVRGNSNFDYNRGNMNQNYNDGYYGTSRNNDYLYGDNNSSNGYYGDNYYSRTGVRYNGSNDGVFSTASIDPYNNNNGGTYHPLKSNSFGSKTQSTIGYGNYNTRYNDGYNTGYEGNFNTRLNEGSYNSDYGRSMDYGRNSNSDYGRSMDYGRNNDRSYSNSAGVSGGLALRANDPDLNQKTPNLLNQADFMGYHGSNESRNAFERQAKRNYYGSYNRGGYEYGNVYGNGGGYGYGNGGGYGNGYGSSAPYDRQYYSANYGGGYNY